MKVDKVTIDTDFETTKMTLENIDDNVIRVRIGETHCVVEKKELLDALKVLVKSK